MDLGRYMRPGWSKDMSSFVHRLGERRIRHRQRGVFYRVLVALGGASVLFAGIAMLVLPGPGMLVTALGLAILALEFAWAEHLLSRVAARLEAARLRVSRRRGR